MSARTRHPHDPFDEPLRPMLGVGLTWFLLFVLLGVITWQVFGPRFGALLDPGAQPRAVTARGDLAAGEQATVELFEQASPGVVHISTSRVGSIDRGFFGLQSFEVPEGSGSGFVWNAEGYIVTNFHVLRGANSYLVRLADGRSVEARYVGGEADYDLAVLKIDVVASSLRPILIGSSADLRVGQRVFAIGNPFGLDQTLTTGIISGLDRVIGSQGARTIRGVIQTDAAINPGNSGGPLLDSAGLLIGVNTAIYSPSGAYAGVGFAVPVDTVNRVVPQILRTGSVVRPVLGVDLVSDRVNRMLKIDGILVSSVRQGAGAHLAGLRGVRLDRLGQVVEGDIILELEGEQVRSHDDLLGILDRHEVGDTVRVRVRRLSGRTARELELRVRLSSPQTLQGEIR